MPRPPARPAPSAWGRGRELLLEAARSLFIERGYSGVRTREIADKAGVTEAMIYRHFGSKAGLFELAVLAPFNTFLADYTTEWEQRPHNVLDALTEARLFYEGLLDVLVDNASLLRALLAAEAGHGPLGEHQRPAQALASTLDRFSEILSSEQSDRGFRQFDPAIQARLMVGLALSQVVFQDLMYDGSPTPRPTTATLVDEMARFTVFGAYESAGDGPAG